MQRRSSRFWIPLLALCWVACAGGATPAQSAPPASAAGPARGETGATTDEGDHEASAPAAPKRASCDDGTCSPCGDAMCPNGWYCDESAQGGPACGWLPECAKARGCACIKKAFAGCSCEEKDGAAHLACR